MVRAAVCGTEGRQFESVPVYQKMNKEKKLSANTPSGFVDRYGKELALKENLIAKIEENFLKFGDAISTKNIEPININNGYAKRFDNIANLNTSKDNGETTISIFAALKRDFPMKIDMMEKHPLGSQAFIPMKETTFLVLVAPEGEKPDIKKIESF